jgi:hypothetical protein
MHLPVTTCISQWIEPNGVAAAIRAAGGLSRDDARKHALLLDLLQRGRQQYRPHDRALNAH